MNRENEKLSQPGIIRRAVCGTEYNIAGKYAPQPGKRPLRKLNAYSCKRPKTAV